MKKRDCISLFSSAGIGELGVKANNIEIIVSNELLHDRHEVYAANYPETYSITGDINEKKNEIINQYRKLSGRENPFLIYATPPCQGMSSNGAGKLLNEIIKGNRAEEDPRNKLIIPTIEIINQLKPEWVILENVPNMRNTLISDDKGNVVNIMKYIEENIDDDYIGRFQVMDCSDYGISTSRRRLITIYTRNKLGKDYILRCNYFFSEKDKTTPINKSTLFDAIGHLPELHSKENLNSRKDFHEYHYVPILKSEKYFWIENTPEGQTAFSNQCVNKKCKGFINKTHGSSNVQGKHQSNSDTPLYCENCGEILPRPNIIDKVTKKRRLIKGFQTSYKRMHYDKPGPTLTQNYQFEASDNKIHPTQNRVLSIYEALVIQSINEYDYKFKFKGHEESVPKSLINQIIGESVPPKLIDLIVKKIIDITENKIIIPQTQLEL